MNPVPDLIHHPPLSNEQDRGARVKSCATYKSDFLNILSERGFIHQVSEPDVLDAKAAGGPLTAYIGFDCTAASLHIGSLLPIMMLYWLQQTGHRPIALMGGGTTRVGDPSGKDESRRILTEDMINENLVGIRAIFSKFLKFERRRRNAVMANNADWLNKLNYIDFLRDVGKHFSVNRMLAFDSVKMRLERQQKLSFLEFNYMVLQTYDFVELNKLYGCALQMGGSTSGAISSPASISAAVSIGAQMFALTAPLITTSSGAKMGKTAAGAVWLNADMVSPYDYWQYWRNTEDGDVVTLPQAVHDAAACRDRAAYCIAGPGDQRSQEGSRHRGDCIGARPRRRRRGRRHRAQDLRGRHLRPVAADRRSRPRIARARHRRAYGIRRTHVAGFIKRRCAPSDQGRRPQDQRRNSVG